VRGLALAALAGVVPGFLAYQAYGFMVRELGATRAGLVMYLSPVYAALIAWLALGELPQWFHAVGAALILPSIYFASRPSTGRATPAAARPLDGKPGARSPA
jgi:drug/metabolite transporter (DMT)-like permease